ncbi:MAG: glycerol dehydratase reactivase beta/small subunit family protein [Blautia sp.]|nr:glycerol dehydratase reactivase beta/small subunit family protein [Blautia sp.]
MKATRPCVFVFCNGEDKDYLGEVLAGIEEEGVPYHTEHREGTLDELAFAAAKESALGAGIGICGQEGAMQMAPLPLGRNVFEIKEPTCKAFRRLGMNCARAFKRRPFLPLKEQQEEGGER